MRTSWIVTALRLILGVVFAYAAYTKLRQDWLVFALSIDAYRLLPSWAVFAVARSLPWAELALAIGLLAGVGLRYVAAVTSLLLVGFYASMIYAFHAGAGIDCGCFGVGEPVSAWTLLRDGALLAMSLALTWLVSMPSLPISRSSSASATVAT